MFRPIAAAPLHEAHDIRLVPRVADQRFAGPEQDHQQDADHPQHGKNRLVQQDFDDAVPEPGRGTLHPGPERLLAGLVNIVPELAKPGETQGLIGHEPRAVIDHEDESAGQKQQADKPEETADHASPYICRAGWLAAQYRGSLRNSTPSASYAPFPAGFPSFRETRKPLTVQDTPSIRPPMAAGAIPPPLFFEQRRCRSILAPAHGILKNTPINTP